MILKKILKFLSSLLFFKTDLHIMFDGALDKKQFFTFELMRTQPQISVGYSVHYWVSCAISKQVF